MSFNSFPTFRWLYQAAQGDRHARGVACFEPLARIRCGSDASSRPLLAARIAHPARLLSGRFSGVLDRLRPFLRIGRVSTAETPAAGDRPVLPGSYAEIAAGNHPAGSAFAGPSLRLDQSRPPSRTHRHARRRPEPVAFVRAL